MSWWDGDMRQKDKRTLLQWANSSALFQTGRAKSKPKEWPPKPMSARARHGRSRRLAEMSEGVSSRHDNSDWFGPFSYGTLWRWRR